jgi:hypothetical protein
LYNQALNHVGGVYVNVVAQKLAVHANVLSLGEHIGYIVPDNQLITHCDTLFL